MFDLCEFATSTEKKGDWYVTFLLLFVLLPELVSRKNKGSSYWLRVDSLEPFTPLNDKYDIFMEESLTLL